MRKLNLRDALFQELDVRGREKNKHTCIDLSPKARPQARGHPAAKRSSDVVADVLESSKVPNASAQREEETRQQEHYQVEMPAQGSDIRCARAGFTGFGLLHVAFVDTGEEVWPEKRTDAIPQARASIW